MQVAEPKLSAVIRVQLSTRTDDDDDVDDCRSRKENLQLSSEYNKLQESYKHLEALKEKLASSEVAWRQNLTDAQKDAQKSKQEVRDTALASSSSSSFASSSSAQMATPARGHQLQSAANQEQVDGIDVVLGCCTGLLLLCRFSLFSLVVP